MMKRKRNDELVNNCNEKKIRIEESLSTTGKNNDEEEDLCTTDFDTSISKKEEFVLTREIAHNAILCDISGNQWRIGAPIGKGSFGEIYLASDNIAKPVEIDSAPYVTKIERHSNGPLFVEIHCLLNVNKQQQETEEEREEEAASIESLGIPKYIASGSHYFNDSRYRFLIINRYKASLHSIIKIGRLSRKHFLIIASQIIDVLMHLHEKHYVHSDIKSENIMLGLHNCLNGPSKSFLGLRTPLENDFKKMSKSIQFSGSNPLRSCRMKDSSPPDRPHHLMYNDMVQSHYLRPGRAAINYSLDENSRSSHTRESDDETNNDDDSDDDFQMGSKISKRNRKSNGKTKQKKANKSPSKIISSNQQQQTHQHSEQNDGLKSEDHDHVYLIDYGLATKFVDTNGEHRPFCMDQRRAHDGTLEFTSRDAHFGTHSRRSDLECLGYNLIYWSEGYLPWKDEKLKDQPELVHRLKEVFMTDVKEMLKLLYGKEVPKFLAEYMEYVGHLEFDEEPNYNFLKGLFEKEFIKLGYKKSDMHLNLSELREETEPCDKNISEHELMMMRINDLKTVTKLGFLVTTDNVDGTETVAKPNESLSLNISCKASPKNLRSKEKGVKGKRPKRHKKLTEKELITEKMAKGKKLSIHEISLLDPDFIARDRADKEYEKFDEKLQTPTRYKGNPTYAILEVENRLRSKHRGSILINTAAALTTSTGVEVEPIKGYTKSMMDVLKKQQIAVEKQLSSPICSFKRRSREGLRNVIKPTQKTLSFQKQTKTKKSTRKGIVKRGRAKNIAAKGLFESEDKVPKTLPVTYAKPFARKRGRPAKIVRENEPVKVEQEKISYDENSMSGTTNVQKTEIRKRGRPRKVVVVAVPEITETEEDSVYYDIPGEGSSDGIKDISDSEIDEIDQQMSKEPDVLETSEDEILIKPNAKKLRKHVSSNSEENSNNGSTLSKRKCRGRYEYDDDFEVYTDEASNISDVTHVTKSSSVSAKPRRARNVATSHDGGVNTRNKNQSRSTSRSGVISDEQNSEHSQSESEFEIEETENESISDDEEHEAIEYPDTDEHASDASDEFDEDSDSVDIKYSPIKTRHARRRINYMNVKHIRGRRMPNVLNDEVRNFRLVSTRG